jgi:polysaccharide biosynthesis/export protein
MKVPALLLIFSFALCGQVASDLPNPLDASHYRLGEDDQVSIRVADLDKLQLDNAAAPRIDLNGNLNLPVIGHVHASGLTVNELEQVIAERLGSLLQHPQVSVSIVQYRSHPVSVLGAVRNPGVVQVVHPRRLLEVISLAGGLAPEAGDTVKISRNKAAGTLPLSGVQTDETGKFYTASVSVRSLMQADRPELNIAICENDVVTVPRAELVYVLGAVKKAGGYALGERTQLSVLQALSMAEGLDRGASAKSVRLLREEGPGKQRTEISINLKPIMMGSAPDVPLRANDILFIPTSATKLASMRAIEAAVSVGTGFAVFH